MDADSSQLEVGACSETGYVRDENQDRMTGDVGPLGPFYIVADGMGGHKGGALAAQLAIQELTQQIKEAPATQSVEQVIQAAFKKANETIYQKGHAGDPEVDGMGTTAVLLLISGKVARLAHVGDSRAYLYRDGELRQLTTDHTVVQKMVQAGMLKPEDAADHPNANVLERAIGTHESVEVDISKEVTLTDGDAILLCSDGLSGYVTYQEIKSTLQPPSTSQEIVTRLVNLALQKGGKDNVTVQFIQYGPRKAQQPVESPNPEKPITATAVVGASSALAQPSERSEARPLESTKIEKPTTITPTRPGFYSFHTVAALIVGAAISASGLYAFMNKRMVEFQGQLEETKTARARAEEEMKSLKESASKSVIKWQKELEETKTARARAEKRVKELEAQGSKLQKELDETKTAMGRADKETNRLKAQLAQAEQSTNKITSKLQKDLDEARTAKAKAETQTSGLKRQLEEKERQLEAANSEIRSLKASQPKESPKASGTEGATAPGKTSGLGATTGQKETSETK